MSTKNNAANLVTNNVIALPKLPKMKKGGSGTCLCGCGGATSGGRFQPGHDARLLAVALRIERGIMTEESAGIHGAMAMIEVRLRAAAGLTNESHAKAQITAADAAGVERAPAKKAPKPRLVKRVKVTADPVELALNDNAGTEQE